MKTKFTLITLAIFIFIRLAFAQVSSDCKNVTMPGAATSGNNFDACKQASDYAVDAAKAATPPGCTFDNGCTFTLIYFFQDSDEIYHCSKEATCKLKCPKNTASKSCWFGGSASITCPCGQKPSLTAPCPNPVYKCIAGPRIGDSNINYSFVSRGIIKIFPNPSNGQLSVEYQSQPAITSTVVFSVYDVTGRIVFQREEFVAEPDNTFNLELSDLTEGIYLLRSNEGDHISQMKLMINK